MLDDEMNENDGFLKRHLIFLGFILRFHDDGLERERESKTAKPCRPAPLNLKCVHL